MLAQVEGWRASDLLVGPVVFVGLRYDGDDDADVPVELLG